MEEGISLGELFRIIIKRYYIIIIAVILSIIGAIFYLDNVIYEYSTTITILIEPLKEEYLVGKLLTNSIFDTGNDISTETILLTNIANLSAALDKLDLTKYKDSENNSYKKDSLLRTIKSKVSLTSVKDTNIVEVSVQDQNPKFAADYANALAFSLREMLAEYGQDSKNTQIEFLKQQIPETEQKIDEANEKLYNYKAQTGIEFLSNNTKTVVNYISYLQMRIKPLEVEEVKNQSLIKEYQDYFGYNIPTSNNLKNDCLIQEYLKDYTEAYNEYILFDILSNESSIDRKIEGYRIESLDSDINQRINELNNERDKTKRSIINRLRQLISIDETNPLYSVDNYIQMILSSFICEIKINSLNSNIIYFEQEFNQLPLIEKKLTKLQSDVDSLEAIRKELNSLLEQISLTAAAQNNNVKLVSPAVVPTTPVSPNRLLVLAISILLSGALSVLLCLLIEFSDDTVHRIDDIKKAFGNKIPVLGWLPLISMKKKQKHHVRELLLDDNSYLSERFKILTSNIIYGKNNDKQIFTITSCGINEGKSFFACNFGICLAKLGYRVLIIDSDIKSPSIEKFFNMEKTEYGFVKILQENKDFDEIIKTPIDNLKNLKTLSPGKSKILPSIFYKKTDFNLRIQKLKNDYDYILFDEPPLEFALDLLSYIKYVDSVLICTRLGICTKSKIEILKEQLSPYINQIGGVIATACPYDNIKEYINKYETYYHNYISNSKIKSSIDESYTFIKTERKSKKIYKRALMNK